jgi:hypothetical protein
MEYVWNTYGTPMESLWNITRATPEQQARNAPSTRWPGSRSDAKWLRAAESAAEEASRFKSTGNLSPRERAVGIACRRVVVVVQKPTYLLARRYSSPWYASQSAR